WMSRGNFPEAEKVFLHLIQNHPDFPEAHNKLATLLYLQGNYHDSVTACRLTLKLNPNHFGAWNGMGMCLYKLARFEEAVKSFEKALQIQPYADVNRVYIARCRS
ncbi:MAG: tetratricopeptide repeat protein, partial [Nitrospinaceae bacterium]|nr:tetratricopeptide repeat protein [Nitrospinaceae bacterium]NIR54057.1 tetratricopeptide repeat protein [Nitrospinaceae bacterium]NIS84474.1 tetratricopeptide repeat protein [Nitrospinaceae bacterium]NIT81270.1 tetratricopeptide repeat protein [Nitrospinaceae bacterium]NIU43557.1 tetratricopeptide repeat protein [Nitrospinaceae bacterium]